MKHRTKLLFICTGNHDCSTTAEDLFRDSKEYVARSAGTSAFATQRVTQELIDWADKVFVMSELEDRHLTYREQHFNIKGKAVYNLEIPVKTAVDKLGEHGVVDLMGVMGYYHLVSMLLNVDRYPLPEGAKPELKWEGCP